MSAAIEATDRGGQPGSTVFPYNLPHWLSLLLIIAYLCLSRAWGAGIAVMETSVKGLGIAFAGRGAACEDAATVFFNPAGMTCLQGTQLELGTHGIFPSARFSDQGTDFATGAPISGGGGGDAGEPLVVTSAYYVRGFAENLRLGIGITSPYGLETAYRPSWVGRYYAIRSQLRTVDINPAIAYQLDDSLSIGGGLSLQYADAEITNAIDLGGIGTGLQSPGTDDGRASVKGNGLGYGFNVGLLIEPSAYSRIGLHYRSKIDQRLEGDARFTHSGSSLATRTAAALRLVDQGARANVSLPETVSVSLFQRAGSRWTLLADATWTRWSRLDELRVEFARGAADSVTTLDWDDTWRLSLGTTYTASARWILRAGLAYDLSPVPNAQRRTPRIPDANRSWVAVGVGYRHSQQLEVDLGYAHLFLDNPRIDKEATGEDTFRGALRGEYESAIDIVGVQLSWTLP